MEHKKSILSCIFMSVAVFLLTLSVYATSGDNSTNVKTNSSQIYSIIVPVGTEGSFDFTIDPYGLITMNGSGSTLEELLKNPPGLVTSDAITIENKMVSDVAVKISASLSPSSLNIRLAKSEDEARAGMADLYLRMSATNSLELGKPAPVMLFGEIGQTEEIKFILEGAGTGKNSVCSFVIDGYANPNSGIWAGMPSGKMGINITYDFETIEDEITTENSSEISSSSSSEVTTDPTEQITTKDPTEQITTKDPTGETTTAPKETVIFDPDAGKFDVSLDKADIPAAPTKIMVKYKNKWYNVNQFGVVKIESEEGSYKISVSNYSMPSGTYDLRIYSGETLVNDKMQLHID